MLLAAARAHQIDLTASWMIGDSESDVLAGRKAECKTARLSVPGLRDAPADPIASFLLEATQTILAEELRSGKPRTPHGHCYGVGIEACTWFE